MTTLKELIYKILLDIPETRDSDKKLIWEVWKQSGMVKETYNHPEQGMQYSETFEILLKDSFMSAPSPESIRRVRQQLQREDLLLGKNLIQPTKEIKQKRVKLSKEKGYQFIQGTQPVFNPETQCYEIY